MRIFGLGDLHVDFPANRELVNGLSRIDHQQDTLILAGDIGHRTELIGATLSELRQRFARVFFVPGNHDLWVAGAAADVVEETSLDRIAQIRELCVKEGVHSEAGRVGAVQIIPLLSWYEPGLDVGGDAVDDTDETMRRFGRRWADRRYCRWPAGLGDDPARCGYFADLNETALAAVGAGPSLSFSHFCPRLDILPPVEYLRFKYLPRVAGTALLEKQLRASGSALHLFGHTHIPCDKAIEGVRYVNAPLGYPRERARWGREGIRLLLLSEDAQRLDGGFVASPPSGIRV
ncbi:MAG: metallophosphoesterase [Gemmatimonadetes bacterium]|jgi:predicted phosphodiesterase|nr:metallophosphoesterase [Gemmatimonadota bacterium]MBT6144743.1 metallophosphoesterase [Gemmatimonadota bacterium]MBT7861688.1 metallophosphoesterase [Gemmatimonadota bacterium]